MITRVQSKAANTGAVSGTTLSVVLDAAPTAGNVLVMAIAGSGTQMRVTCPNVVWLHLPVNGTSATYSTIAIGRVFSSASATITITGTSNGGIAAAGAEYSGISNIFDKAIDATSTGTDVASGATATTTTANQLWIGAFAHRASNGVTYSSPTNGFSIVGQDKTTFGTTSDRTAALLEKIVSSTGTPDAGATSSASGVWVAQVLTLEELVAAGGGGSIFAGEGGVIR